jgi:TDG/mug DNA glycosylase family protein
MENATLESGEMKVEATAGDDQSVNTRTFSEGRIANLVGSTFKARMAQFKYSPLKEAEGLRRSSRLGSPRALISSTTSSASSSPRKRSRPRQASDDNNIKAEEEQESVLTQDDSTSTPPRLKKRRSTTKERSAQDPHNPVNNLVDSMRPGLTLVCIGLNPGLMTAATGHAYAHPSNRFWHLLHDSGVTPKKHIPAETRDLMDLYNIGNTNICARPTRSGDGLSKEEMAEGAVILDNKIALYKPEAVVIVGKSIWETIWMAKKGQKRFKDPDFHWGWQDEDMQLGRTWEDGQLTWPGAKTYVATSTSGLAATLRPAEKLAIWKPLGDWMTAKRQEANAPKSE